MVLTEGEDRATLTAPGTIGAVTADMVSDDLLRRARHLHTSGYYLQGAPAVVAELFRRARAAGATTSLDPGADPDERFEGGLIELLPLIDQLLPNEVEALGLAGTDDVETAARRLAEHGSDVLVKCGADGVLAVVADQLVRAPALPGELVDTVGAGDTTNAGWLAARLTGLPVDRAARLAAVCGSLSTRARGGTARPAHDGRSRGRAVIVCVAANPSVDKLFQVERVVPGGIHRPSGYVQVAGGKGLNAARAAATLGADVQAIALLAGHAGRWIAEQLRTRRHPRGDRLGRG